MKENKKRGKEKERREERRHIHGKISEKVVILSGNLLRRNKGTNKTLTEFDSTKFLLFQNCFRRKVRLRHFFLLILQK